MNYRFLNEHITLKQERPAIIGGTVWSHRDLACPTLSDYSGRWWCLYTGEALARHRHNLELQQAANLFACSRVWLEEIPANRNVRTVDLFLYNAVKAASQSGQVSPWPMNDPISQCTMASTVPFERLQKIWNILKYTASCIRLPHRTPHESLYSAHAVNARNGTDPNDFWSIIALAGFRVMPDTGGSVRFWSSWFSIVIASFGQTLTLALEFIAVFLVFVAALSAFCDCILWLLAPDRFSNQHILDPDFPLKLCSFFYKVCADCSCCSYNFSWNAALWPVNFEYLFNSTKFNSSKSHPLPRNWNNLKDRVKSFELFLQFPTSQLNPSLQQSRSESCSDSLPVQVSVSLSPLLAIAVEFW